MLEREARATTIIRGEVCIYLHGVRDGQMTVPDDMEMWSFLSGLHGRISREEVRAFIKDLCERGYLRFQDNYDEESGRQRLTQVALTSKGRDLCERRMKDSAVLIP